MIIYPPILIQWNYKDKKPITVALEGAVLGCGVVFTLQTVALEGAVLGCGVFF